MNVDGDSDNGMWMGGDSDSDMNEVGGDSDSDMNGVGGIQTVT